jgi:lipopolysaccharide export system permease protein
MNILDKHILKAHIGPFLFGSLLVLFLFLFQFVLKYLDQLVGKGLSYWVILQLIVLNLAWMVVLAVPMGVLFSTLMTFGNLSANHEVTVIKASGGSLIRMMTPVLIAGLMLTYGLFLFNDILLPSANHKAKSLFDDIRRMKPTFNIQSGQFAMDLDGYTILARNVDSLKGTLFNVTIYDNSKTRATSIANADTGIVKFNANYSKIVLELINGEAHQLVPLSINDYRKVKFDRYEISIPVEGFSFEKSNPNFTSKGDRELTISEMQVFVDTAKVYRDNYQKSLNSTFWGNYHFLVGKAKFSDFIKTGDVEEYDTTHLVKFYTFLQRASHLRNQLQSDLNSKNDYERTIRTYQVEIYKKYAIPVACFLFILVGAPLGIITKGGNFGLSAAMSLGFYIFYWACLIGGEKLADRGLMSPFMSMWLGNFILGFLGIILTLKVSREGFYFITEPIKKIWNFKFKK